MTAPLVVPEIAAAILENWPEIRDHPRFEKRREVGLWFDTVLGAAAVPTLKVREAEHYLDAPGPDAPAGTLYVRAPGYVAMVVSDQWAVTLGKHWQTPVRTAYSRPWHAAGLAILLSVLPHPLDCTQADTKAVGDARDMHHRLARLPETLRLVISAHPEHAQLTGRADWDAILHQAIREEGLVSWLPDGRAESWLYPFRLWFDAASTLEWLTSPRHVQ